MQTYKKGSKSHRVSLDLSSMHLTFDNLLDFTSWINRYLKHNGSQTEPRLSFLVCSSQSLSCLKKLKFLFLFSVGCAHILSINLNTTLSFSENLIC